MVGADGIVDHALPSSDVRVNIKCVKSKFVPHRESWFQGRPVFVYHKSVPLVSSGKPELAPFCWDGRFPGNPIIASVHRFARQLPQPDPSSVACFREFSRAFISRLTPAQKCDVVSFNAWLEKTNYSPSRKTYLRKLRGELNVLTPDFFKSKSFIKAEIYEKIGKLARAINSYSDESKAYLGPLFHTLDKAFFKHRFFVKGSNPKDWPERLRNMFGDSHLACTDFTSFESHHQGHFAETVFEWFLHMSRELDLDETTINIVRVFMTGRNVMEFKEVTIECDQRLMSGALWTSSANSVLNLLVNTYCITRSRQGTEVERANWAFDEVVGIVEGDDGAFVDYGQTADCAQAIGCAIKMEHHENFAGAGFCGIICDPDNLTVLKNPKTVLRKFFLLPSKYAHARQSVKDGLLRAKALSYYHAYRTCPIVGQLCYEVIKATSRVKALDGATDAWHMQALGDAIAQKVWEKAPQVADSSRLLIERMYDISVDEQLRIERDITLNPTSFHTGWASSDDMVFNDIYVSRDVVKPERMLSRQMLDLWAKVGATEVLPRVKTDAAKLRKKLFPVDAVIPDYIAMDQQS